jgi:hypothetical protein
MPYIDDPEVQENIRRIKAAGGGVPEVNQLIREFNIDTGNRLTDFSNDARRNVIDPVANFLGGVAKDTFKAATLGNTREALKGKTPPPEGLSPRRLFPRAFYEKYAPYIDLGVSAAEDLSTVAPLVGTAYKAAKPVAVGAYKAVVRNLPGANRIIKAKRLSDESIAASAAENTALADKLRAAKDTNIQQKIDRIEGAHSQAASELRSFSAKQADDAFKASLRESDRADKARKAVQGSEKQYKAATEAANLNNRGSKEIREFFDSSIKTSSKQTQDAWKAAGNIDSVFLRAGDLPETLAKYQGGLPPGILDPLLSEAAGNGGFIALNRLKDLRTKVGSLLRNPNADGPANAVFAKVYDVMEDAARTGKFFNRTENLSQLGNQGRIVFTEASGPQAKNLTDAIAATFKTKSLSKVKGLVEKKTPLRFTEGGAESRRLNKGPVIEQLTTGDPAERYKRAFGGEYDEIVRRVRNTPSVGAPKLPKGGKPLGFDEALEGIPGKPKPPYSLLSQKPPTAKEILAKTPEIPDIAEDAFGKKVFPKTIDEVLETLPEESLSNGSVIRRILLPAGLGGLLGSAGGAAGAGLGPVAVLAATEIIIPELVKRYGKKAVLGALKASPEFAFPYKTAAAGFAVPAAKTLNREGS